MLEIAMQMLFCLLIAALLGGIIGYLLGRISKCETSKLEKRAPLYDYDQEQQQLHTPHKEVFATLPDATIKKHEKGIKPISLSAPKNGIADDLKEISGIGLKIENALYELGIFHFSQIAAWTNDNITWIDNYLSYKGRVVREDWIGQAKRLSMGSETDSKKSH
jgi:predicted flap endonuclease-1-like 5' DNA nuclease